MSSHVASCRLFESKSCRGAGASRKAVRPLQPTCNRRTFTKIPIRPYWTARDKLPKRKKVLELQVIAQQVWDLNPPLGRWSFKCLTFQPVESSFRCFATRWYCRTDVHVVTLLLRWAPPFVVLLVGCLHDNLLFFMVHLGTRWKNTSSHMFNPAKCK